MWSYYRNKACTLIYTLQQELLPEPCFEPKFVKSTEAIKISHSTVSCVGCLEKYPKIRNKKRAVGISLATGRHSAANQTSVLKPLRQNLTPVTRTPFNNESACGRGQIWWGAILTSPCSPASWEKLSEDRLKLELQQKYDKGESKIQWQHRWLCLRRGGRDLVKQ